MTALGNPLNGDLPTPGASSSERSTAPGYLAFRHCSGFRVEWPDGDVGFVEDVLFGADSERPAALAVRSAQLGDHVDVVPLEAVEAIIANERTIWLRQADGTDCQTPDSPLR